MEFPFAKQFEELLCMVYVLKKGCNAYVFISPQLS
jgi:hypothetical protein